MIGFVRTWLLGLVGAAVFCALFSELTPPGPVKRVQRVVCALLLSAALLLPLRQLDLEAFALNAARSREQAAALTGSAEELSQRLNRTYIQAELEAYILDKAHTLGAQLSGAAFTLHWSSDGLWYPTEVRLDGPYHRGLSECIEGELGIPAEKQRWSDE